MESHLVELKHLPFFLLNPKGRKLQVRLEEYTNGTLIRETSINSKFICFIIHRYLQYKIQKYFLYSQILVCFTSYSQRYDIVNLHVLSKQNIHKYGNNFFNKPSNIVYLLIPIFKLFNRL